MSMSKKDFIALADVIRKHNQDCESRGSGNGEPFYYGAVLKLAAFCANQNPAFNRERWLAYIAGECGPSGGVVKPKGCKVHNTEGKIYVAYCTCGKVTR